MNIPKKRILPYRTLLAASIAATLIGCGGNDNNFDNVQTPTAPEPTPVEPTPAPIPAFDTDGVLTAEITWTTYGVPHVKADNLESMAYGVGYAFAKDNLCISIAQNYI